MKKILLIFAGLGLSVVVIYGAFFYWRNLRGIKPAIFSPPGNISELIEKSSDQQGKMPPAQNATDFPLKLPDGFRISIFAKDLPGARVLVFDSLGNLWVSQTKQGTISLLEIKDGKVTSSSAIFRDLRNPHGLVFDPKDPKILYIAKEHRISKVAFNSPISSLIKEERGGEFQKIADLSAGGGHFTRTLGFGPDGRLYVSIGSSCNVCIEKDERRAAIYSMNEDGSDFRPYATGLRNAVFFTWSPVDGQMWATEMGRDLLGDDLPPDEINIVVEGGDYGWPYCYGKRIFDDEFNGEGSCHDTILSEIDIPAHSAPLGLAFVPESGWPEDYRHDLLVAFHGSWNRSVPTGYKLVRLKLDEHGSYEGTEDFITGWLTADNAALGRPVDVVFGADSALYVSDDKAGVIYRIDFLKK